MTRTACESLNRAGLECARCAARSAIRHCGGRRSVARAGDGRCRRGDPRRSARATAMPRCAPARGASTASNSSDLAVDDDEFACGRTPACRRRCATPSTRPRRGSRASTRGHDRGRIRSKPRRACAASACCARSAASACTCRRARAPLPSTALMLGVPARLAGCREVVLCTPPRRDGSADPAVLLRRAALRHRARVQARRRAGDRGDGVRHRQRAALRQAVRPRQRLRHRSQAPGRRCAGDGAAIDMPAGPSEVLVIADAGANRRRSSPPTCCRRPSTARIRRCCCVSDDDALLDAVDARSSNAQLACAAARRHRAPGAGVIARHSRAHRSRRRWTISNRLRARAPDPGAARCRGAWLPRVEAAGSVFLGDWAPEALGDYCSGTNHVLPTGGAARAMQRPERRQLPDRDQRAGSEAARHAAIGPCAVELARAEGPGGAPRGGGAAPAGGGGMSATAA